MRNLLVIHGALGSAGQMKAITDCLSTDFAVHTVNLPGHGGSSFPGDFSIPSFSRYVEQYCDDQGIESTSIFGYSMGGYIAMMLARKDSQRFSRIITLGTKYHWDQEVAEKEASMLQPEVMEQKIPRFVEMLASRHGRDWRKLVEFTATMMKGLGRDNILKAEVYTEIKARTLIMLGDRDKMVSLEETREVYRLLPNGAMAILPLSPHPIEQIKPELVRDLVKNFLE